GQTTMAEAVGEAVDRREHLWSRPGPVPVSPWPTWCPRSGTRWPRRPRSWSPPRPSRCRTSSSTVTFRAWPRHCPRCCSANPPSRCSRDAATTCAATGCRPRVRRQRTPSCSTHANCPPWDDSLLFDPRQLSSLGRQVSRLHEWAEETVTGDRDELVPGVSDLAWRQVSVGGNECVGARVCPFGQECFAEFAREAAGGVDIVVTNHAMLSIDMSQEYHLLPEHDT